MGEHFQPSPYETHLFIDDKVRFLDGRAFLQCILIFSKFVAGTGGKTFTIYNPATEERICEVAEATPEDVDLAVDAAARAFPEWSNMNAFQRALPMQKLVQLIQKNADELARLDSMCMGK